MPGHTKCCACHAKSSQQTWRSDAPKCNPSQESALTSEQLRWKCLLYCACHGKCIFADPLQMSHACHRFWQCYKTLTFCSLLRRCAIPRACHAKQALNVQKWSVHGVFCTFLTSKCASRHQRRALFRHLNFQKWSEHGVFCAFWLQNVLRATTACNFSSLIWPAGSAPAALASLLFDPPERQIIGKTQCFATFLPFRAPASSFFWLFLSSDLLSSALVSSALVSSALLFSLTLPISAFHLSILSEVWLLNFLNHDKTILKFTDLPIYRIYLCPEGVLSLASGSYRTVTA